MPGWHEATRKLQEENRLRLVGILQEQHPGRARLFMQWKRMDWPLLWDPLNRLEVPHVPITLEIDEYGVIRRLHPVLDRPGTLEEFLAATYPEPKPEPRRAAPPDPDALRPAAEAGGGSDWREYADALLLWGGENRRDEAIEAYGRALRADPEDGWTHFRLGVAYRMRYDSADRQGDDFQRAVDHWNRALAIDPNNYIWRRRIQQYGPRLDKPYPFYDWVATARAEIAARGGTPLPLAVEPGGAELAHPEGSFTAGAAAAEPDPEGKVHRDDRPFIRVETTVVPQTRGGRPAARVHLVFRPNGAVKAHWNNEADDLEVWIDPPAGWQTDGRRFTVANPPETVSLEPRTIEFEILGPEGPAPGPAIIPAYALYYVCEEVRGTCLYRRKDLPLRVP